ncbi:MAG: hypothetical protein H8E36_13065 [Rhodospirillaceae bacterium]|nr:hypothetical protein [Rhodospirillaceae bacterium]
MAFENNFPYYDYGFTGHQFCNFNFGIFGLRVAGGNMVSEYLKHSRSLEELDALIEHDRRAAALIARALLDKDVIQFLAHIDKVSEISLARIVSESEISVVRIMANAEIAAARLAAQTDQIQLEIDKLNSSQPNEEALEIAVAMIAESSRRHSQDVAEEAKQAIDQIEKDSAEAIDRLNKFTKESIAEIQKLKEQSTKNVDAMAVDASIKLKKSKLGIRTAEQAVWESEDASDLILSYAEEASQKMQSKFNWATDRIQTATEVAHNRIRATCKESTKRIEATRDRAIENLKNVIEAALSKF